MPTNFLVRYLLVKYSYSLYIFIFDQLMGEGSRTIHSYARKRMEVKEEANCVQMNSYILLLIYCNQRLLMSYNTIIHMRACLHVYSTKINLSVTATMHALVRHDLPREASRRGNYQVVCDHQLEVPQRLHVRVAGRRNGCVR